jgi:phospholipase/lecithinase/hemolysin
MAWRKILGATLLACGAFGSANNAGAVTQYTAIYAFGDSLSDAGNLWKLDNHAAPVSPPYSNGRFTNGPVWIQDLGKALGMQMRPSLLGGTDYAYGGAQSGGTSVHAAAAIDLPNQFAAFKKDVPQPERTGLFTLWMGANDLFAILDNTALTTAQRNQALLQVVANEAKFVHQIGAMGAKHLLLLTIPDLGKIPHYTTKGAVAARRATNVTKQFNNMLTTRLKAVAADEKIALKIADTFTLIDQAVAHPAFYGYTNVTDPCWTGSLTDASSGTVCAKIRAGQDKYLFWDQYHPTESGHAIIADRAQRLVAPPTAELVAAAE